MVEISCRSYKGLCVYLFIFGFNSESLFQPLPVQRNCCLVTRFVVGIRLLVVVTGNGDSGPFVFSMSGFC